MIVWLDDELFVAGEGRLVTLVALFRSLYVRRHVVIVSQRPGRHGPAPLFDAWRDALPPRIARPVNVLVEATERVTSGVATRSAGRLFLSNRASPEGFAGCWLSLADGCRAAGLPLFVMVENAVNDAAFLRATMPPAWQHRLAQWERTGRLRFIQGGGFGNMRPTVARYAADSGYARETWGLPASAWRAIHFLICDRDAGPGELGEGAGPFVHTCAAVGMAERLHVLERRCQESYLPMQALRHLDGDEPSKIFRVPSDATRFHDKIVAEVPFKNGFRRLADDPDFTFDPDWFANDGAWDEMVELAEKLAAAL